MPGFLEGVLDIPSTTNWSLIAGALLPLAFSLLISPSARPSFAADLSHNLAILSPVTPGFFALSTFFHVLGYRLLNVAPLADCLSLVVGVRRMAKDCHGLERGKGKWYTAARWGFFAFVVGPGYWRLMRWSSSAQDGEVVSWDVYVVSAKLVATGMVLQFLEKEAVAGFAQWKVADIEVNNEWPRKPLLKITHMEGNREADEREEKKTDEGEGKNVKTDKNDSPAPPLPHIERSNLCEAVEKLISPPGETAESLAKMPFVPVRLAYLRNVLLNHPPVWTCGHARCLGTNVLIKLSELVLIPPFYLELALELGLLHTIVGPAMEPSIRRIMDHNILREILSLVWIFAFILVFIFVPVFLFILGISLLLHYIKLPGQKRRSLLDAIDGLHFIPRYSIILLLYGMPAFYGAWFPFKIFTPDPSRSKALPWLMEAFIILGAFAAAAFGAKLLTGADLKLEKKQPKPIGVPDVEAQPDVFGQGGDGTKRDPKARTQQLLREVRLEWFDQCYRVLLLLFAAGFWYLFAKREEPKVIDATTLLLLRCIEEGICH
jgi:hypothetical protein